MVCDCIGLAKLIHQQRPMYVSKSAILCVYPHMNRPLPYLSQQHVGFPPVEDAFEEPSGLLAAGGGLSPEWLIAAYSQGIFPWFSDPEPILWWSPDPRSILHPADAHCSKSLAKFMRKAEFRVTFDQCFDAVIDACSAARRNETGTWITQEMKHAYSDLHSLGLAHSVETWIDGELAGGLYGVSLGGAFFGESMFSRRDNASKIAFISLARQLNSWGFQLLDCQVHSPHIASLGAKEVKRCRFMTILNEALAVPPPSEWIFDG